MCTNGRRKFNYAAGQGGLQDALSAAGAASAHASPLQCYSQICCSTGTLLLMPHRCKSPWIHHALE